MSDYRAIADVGETLIELLRDNMEALVEKEEIVLASPGEIGSKDNVRLSLFLYQVLENVHLKNQDMEVFDPKKLRYPPLALDLYYMLTAHESSGQHDWTEKNLEMQQVLGRAVQVFANHPMLRGSTLKGNLGPTEELHLTVTSLSLDDLTKIWSTFQEKPFKPSVCYLVTPVMIDSTREISTQRVVLKETGHGYMVPKKDTMARREE